MAPTTRKKRASILPASSSAPASSPLVSRPKTSIKYKDDEPDVVSDHDSDHSEYGNANKKNKKRKSMASEVENPFKRRRGRGPTPPAPELADLSDDEGIRDGDESLDEEQHVTEQFDQFSTSSLLPKSLMLQLTADGKIFGVVDIASLLKSNSTLLPATEAYTPKSVEHGRIVEDVTMLDTDQALIKKEKKGFLDLPYELRLRVYRMAFRGASTVDFCTRRDFSRSAHFLRTSKQVHQEGTQILYGENSFHFARNHEKRGVYWQQKWKEVGYKDVRRFLETIGPVNIASLKHVSFMLEDGNKYNFPGLLEDGARRFVEDPVLQRIFHLIGDKAVLQKLAVCFGARRDLKHSDYHFLKAFTEMRCRQLIVYTGFRAIRNRMCTSLQPKMKAVMEVPVDADHELSPAEIKNNKVKLAYEYDMPISGYSHIRIV
ncbi:hypothetical protein LTR10_015536 [Elasticomyces elasticus]|uniref:Uncharacterized protein n=1 Tax=Exophiala sideris TaxID=1016849 RepID=A0ABR0JKY2_9EURO|nr:hypothetical protein LTR10_015536 [Elasticomyces elasticus]KAK5032247.1 hypothetical protein LTR13_007465 [Exophiala sideris]KAK5036245.1 hypothetical protein LTS07_001971 [Exophiala sideris]KAK5066628.1 hypothetical protein LTR69_001975 [Exophiala sideris]KAK5180450.1 hypothetical protein LTR44_007208 [Eurotiomycetes sp. CCFEE 6388]